MKLELIIFAILTWLPFSTFAQKKPIMVKANDLKEVEVSAEKQRSRIIELKKKDLVRKGSDNYRSERKPIRNRTEVRQRVQKKVNLSDRKSRQEKPLKRVSSKRKSKEKKLQRARRFREKDTHIFKSGARGQDSRKARLPEGRIPPRP